MIRTDREVELELEVIDLRKRLIELEQVAITDPLTGLLNRRGGERALARMTSRAARSGEELSAVMLDIDHFKAINDTHGHGNGDRVLERVGEIIAEHLRTSDAGIRWGGEEFLIITDHVGGAMTLAERLRRAIARNQEMLAGLPRMTASFGVAPITGPGWARSVAEADVAMYRAKKAGRNRVALAILYEEKLC